MLAGSLSLAPGLDVPQLGELRLCVALPCGRMGRPLRRRGLTRLRACADFPLPGDSAATDEQLIAEFEQSVSAGAAQPRVPRLQHERPIAEEQEDVEDAGEAPGQACWGEPCAAHTGEGTLLSPKPSPGEAPHGYHAGEGAWQPAGRAVPGSSLGKRRPTGDPRPSEHVVVHVQQS